MILYYPYKIHNLFLVQSIFLVSILGLLKDPKMFPKQLHDFNPCWKYNKII